jgi:TorA maturation chaperone TorD
MHDKENIDWHIARSHIYGLLGGLLSARPAAETISQLTSPQAVDFIDTIFDDPEIGSKMNRLADLYRTGMLSAEQVALDFEGLMRVPGASYTHPYESNYSNLRSGEASVKWGGLCGPQAREVERFYLAEGLAPRYDRVDFADHIGAELAFMAHMCRKTAEAVQMEKFDDSQCLQAKQRQFAYDHLLAWAEDFSVELETKADTPFFQAVAAMLAAFLKIEKHACAAH